MMLTFDDSPVCDAVQRELAAYRTNEAGMPVAFVPAGARDAQLIVTSALSEFPIGEGEGVLVIAARPLLAPGTALHGMLLKREIDPRSIALFAARQWRNDERALIAGKRIQSYSMLEISREGLSEMTDAVMSYVRGWRRFHVVIDLNVVDPAFAPGVGAPVPGGLTSRELIYVIQRLRLIKTLGLAYLILDASPDPATCRLAAHLIAELSGDAYAP